MIEPERQKNYRNGTSDIQTASAVDHMCAHKITYSARRSIPSAAFPFQANLSRSIEAINTGKQAALATE